MFRSGTITALAFLVLLALACGSGDDDASGGSADTVDDAQSEDIQTQLENLRTQFSGQQSRIEFHDDRAVRSEMLTAMLTLYVEDLEGLADELAGALAIPEGTSDRAERMRRALQLVVWPEQFQERASGLTGNLDSLWDAVSVGNLNLARESASQAVATWQAMEAEVYLEVGGPQPGHDHNSDGSHATPVPTG